MKLLLYTTKAKPYLYGMYSGFETRYGYHLTNDENVFNQHTVLNGKIVAECDFEVEEMKNCFYADNINCFYRDSRLTFTQLKKYLQDNKGYAIHIKNLHIFDKPKELSEYGMDFPISPIVKAPQNMMYANGIGGRYILISIRPEWLCKILNGEKTVEVRKKVLKEMIKCL